MNFKIKFGAWKKTRKIINHPSNKQPISKNTPTRKQQTQPKLQPPINSPTPHPNRSNPTHQNKNTQSHPTSSQKWSKTLKDFSTCPSNSSKSVRSKTGLPKGRKKLLRSRKREQWNPINSRKWKLYSTRSVPISSDECIGLEICEGHLLRFLEKSRLKDFMFQLFRERS